MTIWKIRGIQLPIEPKSFRKKTIRVQKPTAVIGDFPDPGVNQPTKFEMQIKGWIFPKSLAVELDEATKNAETENLPVSVSDLGVEDTWLSGLYSVSRSDIAREKPIYDAETGEEVYSYTITFAKFADLGSDGPGEEGGPDEDEPGAGFMNLPEEVGFDSNGDGDIDADEIFNWLTNIFTPGVIV